jgi:hypothetical protein
MAKNSGVAIRIRLLDDFSDRMTAINKRLDALTAKPRAIARGLATISDKAGLSRLGDQAKIAGERVSNLGQKVQHALGPLAAFSGAASLAGILMVGKNFSLTAVEVAKATAKTGEAASRIQELQFAAKAAGSSPQAMTDGLANLSGVLRDAALGQNSEALMGLNALGISLRDVNGKIKGPADMMAELSDRMKNIKDPARAAFVATTFFGGAGEDLIPTLQKGSKELSRLAAEAHAYGAVISDEAVEAGKQFNLSVGKSGMILKGFADTLGAKLMPILNPIIDKFNAWAAANRELIATKIEAVVGKIGDAVQSIDFDKVLAGLTSFVESIGRAIDFFGGFQGAGIALIAFLNGPLIISAVSAASSLFGLGSSAISAGTRLGALIVPGLIKHLSGFSTVTKLATGAQWLMNAAMAANPVGAVVVAVAALAAAVYAIYENWGKIGDWFNEKIERIKSAFADGLIPGLWAIFKSFNPIVIIAETLDGLTKWLFDFSLFDAGKNLLGSLIDGLKSLLPSFDGIVKTLSGVFDWLFGSSEKASEAVGGIGKAANQASPQQAAAPKAMPSPAVAQAVQQSGGQAAASASVPPSVEVRFTGVLPQNVAMDVRSTGPVKTNVPVGLSGMARASDY